MTPEEQKQFDSFFARGNEVLERERKVTGHVHINVITYLDAQGEFVRGWALVLSRGGFFDLPDYDAIKSWLEVKGYQPYLEGNVFLTSFDEGIASCDMACFAVPNKVWRSSRIISVDESTSK